MTDSSPRRVSTQDAGDNDDRRSGFAPRMGPSESRGRQKRVLMWDNVAHRVRFELRAGGLKDLSGPPVRVYPCPPTCLNGSRWYPSLGVALHGLADSLRTVISKLVHSCAPFAGLLVRRISHAGMDPHGGEPWTPERRAF
jgi:hypothetical protein